MIKSYRDLIAWQKAMQLAVAVYRLSRRLPDSERFGLVVQVRRAAVGIAANLAEGHERKSRGDYRRFVALARGSLAEVETHLMLIRLLEYEEVDALTPVEELANEVGKLLSGLLRRLTRPAP